MMPVVISDIDDLLTFKDIHEVECGFDLFQLVGWNAIAAQENGGNQLCLVEFSRHCTEKQTTL